MSVNDCPTKDTQVPIKERILICRFYSKAIITDMNTMKLLQERIDTYEQQERDKIPLMPSAGNP